MSWTRFGAAVAAFAALAYAQETPAFEVASVKPSGPESKRDSGGGPGTSDPGQYHFYSAKLRDLIATAYHVQFFQILSKVALDHETFDVVAKVPAGVTRDVFRSMMQNLLAERFHLKLHNESREFPAWELTVAASGAKFKESSAAPETAPASAPRSSPPQADSDGFPVLPSDKPGFVVRYTIVDGFVVGHLAARQQPVTVLTGSFGLQDDPPIVDKTGLAGKYNFKLEFSREPPGAPLAEAKVPPVPDLFTAVQQQLGLQFKPRKLPFDVIVVESIARTPTDN